MSLVLYHFESCYYCARVRDVVRDLGVEMEMKDITKNEASREELLAMNGKTQVPCLVIDGKPMLESDDIISYLRENYS